MRCRGRLLWCVLLIMAHSYKSSGFGSESVPVFEPGPGCFCYEQVNNDWVCYCLGAIHVLISKRTLISIALIGKI